MKQLLKNMGVFIATATVAGIISTGPVHAASLTFDSWATTVSDLEADDDSDIDTKPTVLVDDMSNAGFLTFMLTIPYQNAELSGIWLDFGGVSFASGDVASLTTGVSVVDVTTATLVDDNNNIGNGRNLSGGFGAPVNGKSGSFDIGFGFDDGDNGGNARKIDPPFSFTLSTLGGTIGLGDLDRIGLRFQSVGDVDKDGLGNGSEKLIGIPSLPTAPLPAGLPLILLGLGAFAALRLRAS